MNTGQTCLQTLTITVANKEKRYINKSLSKDNQNIITMVFNRTTSKNLD